MKTLLSISSILLLALYLSGCGSSSLSSTDEGDIPEWYMNPPDSPSYFYGVATATSRDMQISIDKATVDARNEVASQVEVKINSLQKSFTEEVGNEEVPTLLQQFTSATKAVVSTSIKGSKVINKELVKDGDNYRSYVLVQYPTTEPSIALMEQLKKNEELYTRFRSSQAYKDLDAEVKKLEKSKAENEQ